jgi:arsenate reductase
MHDEDREWRTFQARIPLTFYVPGGVAVGIVEEVLRGEYESGYTGERLTVLDIGANIGAFSLWAAHRWPGCTINAYEPNPATFALLERSTRSYQMIRCHNAAVYPSGNPDEAFFFRGVGDGQAGLVEELAGTFGSETMGKGEQIRIPVLHPGELPRADVIKIDVEGAEAAIVTHAELSGICGYRNAETCCEEGNLSGTPNVAGNRREAKDMTGKLYNVLFLCTGNSARSIMAECILNRLGQGKFRAFSAGSHPAGKVNPHALDLLNRLNYQTDKLRSKAWDEFAVPGAPEFDFVFTVCDNAAGEACPVWPGQPMTIHWSIPDPATVTGKDAVIAAAFADAYRMLERRIDIFVNLASAPLDRPSLKKQLENISRTEDATPLTGSFEEERQ